VLSACTIGALPTELTSGVLVSTIRQVAERFPDIAIEVREMLSTSQVPALRARKIDLAVAGSVTSQLDDPGIASVLLTEDPIECALLPASHPLAKRSWIRAAELAGQPFLFVSRASSPYLHDVVVQAFLDLGLVPSLESTYRGTRVLWRLTADSVGWSIATRSMRLHPPRGTVAVPVEGLSVAWGIRLLWRRDEADPGVRRVLEAFRTTRPSA
jgi:DNA-binding transcriptional LysR family regulator